MLRTDLDPLPRLRVDPEPPGSGFARGGAAGRGARRSRPTPTGLEAGAVTIDSNGFAMPAYRAMPAGGERLPIVLVVSEIFGVHEHIADVARRFARLGYLAIAPELFVRQGDAKAATDIDTLFATIVSKVPDAQVMGDLDAARRLGRGPGRRHRPARRHRLLLGRAPDLALRRAQPGGERRRRLVRPADRRDQRAPDRASGRVAAALKAPVLGLYGGADTGIPLDTVEAMRLALAAGSEAAKRSEIVVYPEAQHAFFADYRPSYDPRLGGRRLAALPRLAARARRRMTLAWIVVATLAGGVLSVVVAAGLTLAVLSRLVQHLVSLSAGVLLATALLNMLPEAFESKASPQALFATLLCGLLFFFLLEKAELYRHSHHHEGDHHHHHHGFDRQQAGRGGWSVILGDSIHNFCDGIIIAAAFLADTQRRHRHRAGDHRPRDPAGGRRLHRPAQRRLLARPRAALQRRLGPGRGARRRPRLLRRRALAGGCSPTCSWSPRAASSTSPSPT